MQDKGHGDKTLMPVYAILNGSGHAVALMDSDAETVAVNTPSDHTFVLQDGSYILPVADPPEWPGGEPPEEWGSGGDGENPV